MKRRPVARLRAALIEEDPASGAVIARVDDVDALLEKAAPEVHRDVIDALLDMALELLDNRRDADGGEPQ